MSVQALTTVGTINERTKGFLSDVSIFLRI